MTSLLRIDSSARVLGSNSRELADYFEAKWKAATPGGTVAYRDLAEQPLPHLLNSTIEGFYTPPEQRTKEQELGVAVSNELVAELQAADVILISSPMYNLGIPSNLKAYFDQVVRIGQTFAAGEQGYFGLLKNKAVFLITTKGDCYQGTPKEAYNFHEPYLKSILSFMGLNQQTCFSLEGTSMEQQLEQNKQEVLNQIDESFKN